MAMHLEYKITSPFHIFKERSSLPLAIRPEECASTEYTREECPIISSRG